MNSYEIVYTAEFSPKRQLLVESPFVPSVGDLVNLPNDGYGKVVMVEHVYKKNSNEITVFDHFKVYLDWKIN